MPSLETVELVDIDGGTDFTVPFDCLNLFVEDEFVAQSEGALEGFRFVDVEPPGRVCAIEAVHGRPGRVPRAKSERTSQGCDRSQSCLLQIEVAFEFAESADDEVAGETGGRSTPQGVVREGAAETGVFGSGRKCCAYRLRQCGIGDWARVEQG